jgi:hypothetical protein
MPKKSKRPVVDASGSAAGGDPSASVSSGDASGDSIIKDYVNSLDILEALEKFMSDKKECSTKPSKDIRENLTKLNYINQDKLTPNIPCRADSCNEMKTFLEEKKPGFISKKNIYKDDILEKICQATPYISDKKQCTTMKKDELYDTLRQKINKNVVTDEKVCKDPEDVTGASTVSTAPTPASTAPTPASTAPTPASTAATAATATVTASTATSVTEVKQIVSTEEKQNSPTSYNTITLEKTGKGARVISYPTSQYPSQEDAYHQALYLIHDMNFKFVDATDPILKNLLKTVKKELHIIDESINSILFFRINKLPYESLVLKTDWSDKIDDMDETQIQRLAEALNVKREQLEETIKSLEIQALTKTGKSNGQLIKGPIEETHRDWYELDDKGSYTDMQHAFYMNTILGKADSLIKDNYYTDMDGEFSHFMQYHVPNHNSPDSSSIETTTSLFEAMSYHLNAIHLNEFEWTSQMIRSNIVRNLGDYPSQLNTKICIYIIHAFAITFQINVGIYIKDRTEKFMVYKETTREELRKILDEPSVYPPERATSVNIVQPMYVLLDSSSNHCDLLILKSGDEKIGSKSQSVSYRPLDGLHPYIPNTSVNELSIRRRIAMNKNRIISLSPVEDDQKHESEDKRATVSAASSSASAAPFSISKKLFEQRMDLTERVPVEFVSTISLPAGTIQYGQNSSGIISRISKCLSL